MSKRRATPTAPTPAARPLPPAVALGISVVVVALVIIGGLAVDRVLAPSVPKAFASCHTAPKLGPTSFSGPPAMCIDTRATYTGVMHTSKGDITFSFLTKQAPVTVNNFIVLAVNGFFNGQVFWRADDWITQSGDPSGTGRGGGGYTIKPEPVAGDETWPPGAMGMYRFPDGALSGSQFFILKSSWPGGNPTDSYNHFATVTVGLDIVSQLTTTDKITGIDIRKG